MKKRLQALAMVVTLAICAMGTTACSSEEKAPAEAPATEAPAETPAEAPAESDAQEPAKDGGWVICYICKDLSQEWFQGTLKPSEERKRFHRRGQDSFFRTLTWLVYMINPPDCEPTIAACASPPCLLCQG